MSVDLFNILCSRLEVSNQIISNASNIWNKVEFDNFTFNDADITIVNDTIQLPESGVYELMLLINTFDNNSARAAHRIRLTLNNVEYSIVEGENYMRDAGDRDTSSIRFPEIIKISEPSDIFYEIQSHSSLQNSSQVLGGWLIIKKL